MSTPRRLFEDPRNTYIIDNNDPGAFDKRFVNRPGVHREQQCCRNRAPVWQSYLIHDDKDPGNGNRTAYKRDDPLQVEDATGESDNITGRNQMKGYVWIEGPHSGYKPDFISPEEWMRWQGVYWIPSPRPGPRLAESSALGARARRKKGALGRLGELGASVVSKMRDPARSNLVRHS